MMTVLLLLLVALCCGPGHGSSLRRPMWYHAYPQNWQNARDICQSEHGGDLLTVLSQEELNFMDLSHYHAWIGLRGHNGHFHWNDAADKRAPGNWVASSSCAFASYQQDSPTAVECTHRHFHFCRGLFSDVFVPQTLSYSNAKAHCWTQARYLSTFPEKSSLHFPGSPLYKPQEFPVWVGLHSSGPVQQNCDSFHAAKKATAPHTKKKKRSKCTSRETKLIQSTQGAHCGTHCKDPGGSWSWGDGQQSDYRNWASDLDSAPAPGSDSCVSVGSQSKSMSVHSCSDAYPFLCYKPSLVLLQELLTWELAVEHCKDLSSSSSFRLLSVDQSHMETIKNVLRFNQTKKVWVGLRFLAGSWFWLDGAPLSVPSHLSCPDSTLGCAALVISTGSEPVIKPCDCSEKLNLLCYNPPL